jgi:flagellar motility protein MotE (MotC chaperone)
MMVRLRLFPVVIIAGVLVLPLRLGDIVRGMSGIDAGRSAAAQTAHPGGTNAAGAQDQPPKAGSPKSAKAEPAPGPNTPPSKTSPAKGGASPTTEAAAGPAPAAPAPSMPPKGDPLSMSEAEIEVLQNLAARRAALDTRAQDLELREKVLKATEQRLHERLKELDAIKTDLEARLKVQEDFDATRLKSLIKVYETMKPKEAARIFEQLDTEVLIEFFEHMKEQKTAPILAAMDPSKAQKITTELAARRQPQRPKS